MRVAIALVCYLMGIAAANNALPADETASEIFTRRILPLAKAQNWQRK